MPHTSRSSRVAALAVLTIAGTLGMPVAASAAFPPDLQPSDRVVAAGGSDSNDGTASRPWRTLQKGADSVPKGGTVWVRQGTYEGFTLIRSGFDGNPIRFRAWPDDDRPVIDGDLGNRPEAVRLKSVHDARIVGFVIRDAHGGVFSGAGVQIDSGATRIRVRDNIITRNQSFGIYQHSSTDVTIDGNEISHNAAGIYLSRDGDGTRILNNDVHHTDRMVRNTSSPRQR